MERISKLIGGVLLVSGTSIGAGILALPVSTGLAGFVPSVVLFFLCWAYLTITAFLMLEVSLWMGPNTNLITMAKKTIGPIGEAVAWIAYLYLLYALTTAYIAGSGPIVIQFLSHVFGFHMPAWLGSIPLLLAFGIFVARGTWYVDWTNRLLMVGLVVTYFIMITVLTPHIDQELLDHVQWGYVPIAVSVVVTSFGFHIIIPTLNTYLKRDVPLLVKSLLIGSVVPLIVYLIWEWAALGVIPLSGPHGIAEGYVEGANGAALIARTVHDSGLSVTASCFAFFAIMTSFLGVSMSLFDFLADGFKIEKTVKGRLFLYALTFFPPMFIALTYPRAFLSALEYAGAFGVVTLLGILPAAMVWAGRYSKGFHGRFKVPGGRPILLFAILFSCAVMAIEIANKAGYTENVHLGVAE